jgi:hypothetical protein
MTGLSIRYASVGNHALRHADRKQAFPHNGYGSAGNGQIGLLVGVAIGVAGGDKNIAWFDMAGFRSTAVAKDTVPRLILHVFNQLR